VESVQVLSFWSPDWHSAPRDGAKLECLPNFKGDYMHKINPCVAVLLNQGKLQETKHSILEPKENF
jgi:hypothetical protein